MLQYQPFVIRIQKDKAYSGFAVDILNALKEKLNFTVEYVEYSVIGKGGDAGYWESALASIANKEVDMLVSGTTITAQRAQFMDFTYPFWEEPSGVLIRTSNSFSFSIFQFVKLEVLLVFISAMLVVGLMLGCMEHLSPATSLEPRRARLSFYDSLWFSFRVALQKSLTRQASTLPGGLLLSSFWTVSVIVLITFSASLIAALSHQRNTVPFHSLQELADDPTYTIYVGPATAHMQLLKDSPPDSLYGKLWKRALVYENGPSYIYLKDKSVMINDVNGLYGFAITSGRCDWAIMKQTFFPAKFGIALYKDAPYTTDMSKLIMKFEQQGLLKRWRNRHRFKNRCEIKRSSPKVSLNALVSVFMIGVIGVGVSVFVLLIEVALSDFTATVPVLASTS